MPARLRGPGPTASRSCSTTRTGGCGTATLIAQGEAALRDAAEAGWVGVYCLQAAISREHVRAASAADTDWPAIAALYDDLAEVAPSPVVELNRAVAVSMSEGPGGRGSCVLDRLADRGGARRATTCCRRPGPTCSAGSAERAEALAEYRRALELAPGAADRAFLVPALRRVAGAH